MILYTTHCPKCKVVQMKLDQKHISYTENDDIETMKSLGIMSAPVLYYNNQYYNFADAVRLINSL